MSTLMGGGGILMLGWGNRIREEGKGWTKEAERDQRDARDLEEGWISVDWSGEEGRGRRFIYLHHFILQ